MELPLQGRQVTDLIVLAGNASVARAAELGGVSVTVPLAPGRTDATSEQTDVASFASGER